jgi:hypothetical protein
MDIPNKLNKAMDGSAVENKAADQATTAMAASVLLNDYFFPGGGVWKPMTIRAATLYDAEQVHKEKREPVTPAVPEKVGDNNETNNE